VSSSACTARLGATTPKIRTPQQADRWTWLILAALTQLRLARDPVADHRLALAAAAGARQDDPRPGPGRFRPPTPTPEQPSQLAETLPTRPRTAQRPKVNTRDPPPSSQKDQHQAPTRRRNDINSEAQPIRYCPAPARRRARPGTARGPRAPRRSTSRCRCRAGSAEPGVGHVARGRGPGVPVDEPAPQRHRESVVRVGEAGRLDRRTPLVLQVARQVLAELVEPRTHPAEPRPGRCIGQVGIHPPSIDLPGSPWR
jgi:hypothetical protein